MNIMEILNSFNRDGEIIKSRFIIFKVINKSGAWADFDEATQGNPPKVRMRGLLF